MEFADYIALLRRRWWLVVLGLVVSVAGAAGATYLQTPKYQTGARLLVSATATDSAIDEITKRQLASQRAVAYAQYATTGPAIAAASKAAGVSVPVSVVATAQAGSPFLSISTTSTDASAAAAVANAFVDVLPTVVTSLDQNTNIASRPKLSVLEPAGVPARAFSPKPRTNLLVGLAIGLILGFAAALLRETLDSTIRRSTDLERLTNLDLLGVIPKEFGDERLIALTRPRSKRTEAYRQVRTNLEFTGPGGMPRSLVVTSAAPGEGKTTVAANLAVIASHAGKRVVLVDADLRRPQLDKVFQLPEQQGLSEVLAGRAQLADVLVMVETDRLAVLPSGVLPRSPSELLGSMAMLELIRQLEDQYDLVVIDTAPVLPVTDALVLAVNVGGVVVVSRLAETTRSSLKRTISLIANVNAHLLGVVANGAIEEEDKRYGYGYGYLTDRRAELEDMVPIAHLTPAGRREDAVEPLAGSAEQPATPMPSAPAPVSPVAASSPVTSAPPAPSPAPAAAPLRRRFFNR